jgi:protein Tex
VRGAISIARRLQDPLAELVKIDPNSIGVGQYQHDVSQPALKKGLDFVVDSCVNSVGVNLNTASYHLLEHVAGIGPSLAKKIVEQRSAVGLFTSRQQLLDIPRFSKKTFEQAAGFLRIANSEHPLDNTGVHPERYPQLEALAARLGKTVGDLTGPGVALVKGDEAFKTEVGAFTFADIVEELSKPGRDPREEFQAFTFREDIHQVADLQPGMVCPGIVTNVTNFGAFVDIGVHQDGLVHISQLSDRFIKDPRDVVNPGDRVSVRVLEVNLDKNQIALTMKSDAEVVRTKPREQSASGEQQRRPPRDGRGDGRGNDRRPPQDNRRDQRQRDERKPKAFNNPFAEQLANWKKS